MVTALWKSFSRTEQVLVTSSILTIIITASIAARVISAIVLTLIGAIIVLKRLKLNVWVYGTSVACCIMTIIRMVVGNWVLPTILLVVLIIYTINNVDYVKRITKASREADDDSEEYPMTSTGEYILCEANALVPYLKLRIPGFKYRITSERKFDLEELEDARKNNGLKDYLNGLGVEFHQIRPRRIKEDSINRLHWQYDDPFPLSNLYDYGGSSEAEIRIRGCATFHAKVTKIHSDKLLEWGGIEEYLYRVLRKWASLYDSIKR